MYPATDIHLHLAHVCAAQRRALATLGATIPALPVRHQPAAPQHSPRETPTAVQIAETGAVGKAEESESNSSRAHRVRGRRPPLHSQDASDINRRSPHHSRNLPSTQLAADSFQDLSSVSPVVQSMDGYS